MDLLHPWFCRNNTYKYSMAFVLQVDHTVPFVNNNSNVSEPLMILVEDQTLTVLRIVVLLSCNSGPYMYPYSVLLQVLQIFPLVCVDNPLNRQMIPAGHKRTLWSWETVLLLRLGRWIDCLAKCKQSMFSFSANTWEWVLPHNEKSLGGPEDLESKSAISKESQKQDKGKEKKISSLSVTARKVSWILKKHLSMS